MSLGAKRPKAYCLQAQHRVHHGEEEPHIRSRAASQPVVNAPEPVRQSSAFSVDSEEEKQV